MKKSILVLMLVALALPSCAWFNRAKDKYGPAAKAKAKQAVQKAGESDIVKDLEQKAEEKVGELKGEEPAAEPQE